MGNQEEEYPPQPPVPEAANQNKPEEPLGSDDELQFSAAQPKQVLVTDLELHQLRKEANEYRDKYLRLLAEMDNARKRMQKEKLETMQYAIENIIIDFLRPIDNLENALNMAEQMSDEVRNWAIGFEMILTQFKDVLAQNKVVPIVSKGHSFDPHDHEAVEVEETKAYKPGTIIDEFVKGYKIGGRTIRPARVKVAKMAQNGKNENGMQD